jgi:hypothetical protein
MNNKAQYLNEEDDVNDNIDEIHSIRIKEFMSLTENNNLQRPKCAISPIDSSNSDNNSSLLIQNTLPIQFSNQSPYLVPISSNIPIVSTPKSKTQNRIQSSLNKTNFHSISDLAKSSSSSSSSSSSNSTQSSILLNNSADNSIYQFPQLTYNCSGFSFQDISNNISINNNNSKENQPIIDFIAPNVRN